MKKNILLSGLIFASSLAFAQKEFDALKYSLTDINGTARYVSMSGAFGALGGDMTTLSTNPAGIAVFRSSELSISPALVSTSTKSVFNGLGSSDSKKNLLINNFGYVGSFRTYDESAISNFNFGVSYNRIKDFNRNISIVGRNRPYSLLDRICVDENSKDGSNLTDYAYETWLINKNSTSGLYEPILTSENGVNEKVDNSMYMMENGSIGQWDFSLGANYGHMFYFGMSVGVQNIDYELNSVYGEDFANGGGLELRNVLTTKGAGVNVKIGTIVRPFPNLRLGFAYNSPTYYQLTDVAMASMTSSGLINPTTNEVFDPNPYYDKPEESFDYQLITPSRLLYSMAYQFGQKGFLSLDCDVVDYRETSLKDSNGLPYGDINSYMNVDFRAAVNLRVGGEYRLTDNVSLRAGAAWYESPVKKTLETSNTFIPTAGTIPQYSVEKDTYYLSGGIGYHVGGFFLDAALQRQMRKENFYNFFDGTDNASYPKYAELSTNKNKLIVTMGFKF